MRESSKIKGSGYFLSTVSVLLLGIPAVKSAGEDTMMMGLLLSGMVLSVIGMGLRWRSHRVELRERDKDRKRNRLSSSRGTIENDSH